MTDVVVITGIRELAEASYGLVRERVQAVCAGGASCMIFGGALGADTVALNAAADYHGHTRLVAIVPFKAGDQPPEARRAILRAHAVHELHLPRSRQAFLRRNDAMLEHAAVVNRTRGGNDHTLVIGFTDGRKTGGTAYTLKRADSLGIRTQTVTVKRA